MNERFESLLDLEAAIRGERVSMGFGATETVRYRAQLRTKTLKAALYRELNRLTEQELQEFGEYRKTAH